MTNPSSQTLVPSLSPQLIPYNAASKLLVLHILSILHISRTVDSISVHDWKPSTSSFTSMSYGKTDFWHTHSYLQKCQGGLPWWHGGWESACQCRGHAFEPWSGRIPHAAEQLSTCTTAAEPALWSPRATTTEAHTPRARAPQREATAMRSPCTAMRRVPRLPQLERAHAQQQGPNSAKNK